MLAGLDEREEYGEDRWIGVGLLENRVVVIIFTEPDESKNYEQKYKNRFGSL